MRLVLATLITGLLFATLAHAQPVGKSKSADPVLTSIASSEDAILAFAAAYEDGDWSTAFALLTGPAQRGFAATVRDGRVADLVPGMYPSDPPPSDDDGAIFAAVMEAAAGADALPFALTDAAVAGQTVDEPKFAIHLVRTAGSPVVFRTKLTAEGWRIDNIAGAGLAPDKHPWGPY